MTAKIPPGLVDCYLAAIEVLYPDRPPDTPFTDDERGQLIRLTKRLARAYQTLGMDSPRAMSDDVRAGYLIGKALRRTITDPTISATVRAQAWTAYLAAIELGLTPTEACEVQLLTGLHEHSDTLGADAQA